MRKRTVIGITIALTLLLVSIIPAGAAKPPSVITLSNGFPSGMHFNLNIHGKDPTTFTTPGPPPYDPATYGNSIFIPEYTADYEAITIQCVSNKSGGTEFVVTDPYAMPTHYYEEGDEVGDPTNFPYADDLAQFNLPYKIQTDDGVINANGYYVYGRILGKPQNSKTGGASSIIVTPNPVIQYDTDGAELPLGMITSQGSFKLENQQFVRFDDTSPFNGKGKSLAKNITDLFMWTGTVYDGSLDISGPDGIPDGVVDEYDIPEDAYTTNPEWDTDSSGDISLDEWITAMADLGLVRYYEDWWVFDVAEMVIQSWGIENDGTKLLQIRFYPVAKTTFTEKAHIVVNKAVTDPYDNPISDNTTLFNFQSSYRNDWQMTSNQFCLSLALEPGAYTVTELEESGWDLANIIIQDPTGGSTPDIANCTANIDLAEGETVIVTFVNKQELIE